ncbi:MAG: tetratricopeptide repeat protein [Gemmatimonadales bacterium]|nr:tetratricopeptide repeat protein [Gemmatimonadales bacterium]
MSRIYYFPVVVAALIGAFTMACDGPDRTPRTSRTSSVPATPASATTEESGTLTPPVVDAAVAPANVSYADAESAFQRRRYAEAAELFASYTASQPDNAWGHYMYGLSAWKSGAHERALEQFDEALRLDPNHRKSLLNSGRVLLETSRPQEALSRIERALAIEPLFSEGLRLLGRARNELGQVPEAIDAYQRAISLNEQDVWAMNNLGLIYIQQGRSDEALPPLARAVQLRSNAPVFQNNLGMALERSGHTAAARHAYASAIESDSTYAKAAASLTRLGGPVDDTVADSAETVDLAVFAREFQAEIERWRDTTSSDSVAVEMVRDTVVSE